MEIFFALLFYAAFSLFGLIGLPLVSRFISNRHLALSTSKLTGLVVFGYVVWLGSSLHILDYQNRWLVRGMLCFFAAIGVIAIRKSRPTLRDVLGIEGISFGLYLAYLFLRSYHASADGTEHFMDMALLSAAGKTHVFPFVDPWYAGKLVNYYYYGSYVVSLISNLAGVPYAIAYNLALGWIYSQAALLTGALTFALTGLKRFGVLAAFLVTTAGTLFYGQCAIRTTCSYTSSTRLFSPSYIINEIPSYSFTVGNLHAHLLALPFFLLGLCLLYALASSERPRIPLFALLALSLATSGMTNSWDAITLFFLLAVLTFIKVFTSPLRTAATWIASGIGTLAAVVVLMSPAWRQFDSPVLGVGFIPNYISLHVLKNVQYPTPISAVAGIWGVFLSGIATVAISRRRKVNDLEFMTMLVIGAIGILVGIEVVFIKDIYSVTNPSYFRANTTFKFGYHAWVLLSIAFAACVAAGASQKLKTWLRVLCGVAVLGGAIYPIEAIRQYYLSSMESRTLDSSAWMKADPGDWDIVQYIRHNIPERSVIAEAVGESYSRHSRITTFTGMTTPMGWQWHEWTWRFRTGETVGRSLPEMAATSWAPVSITAQLIERLYTTQDPAQAKAILDQYRIQYVVVSALERKSYPRLGEAKFHQLGRVVFESHGSELFEVRRQPQGNVSAPFRHP